MTDRKAERFTAQEFRDLEHALQVVTSLTSHARGREVAHEVLVPEGKKASDTLKRLRGFA